MALIITKTSNKRHRFCTRKGEDFKWLRRMRCIFPNLTKNSRDCINFGKRNEHQPCTKGRALAAGNLLRAPGTSVAFTRESAWVKYLPGEWKPNFNYKEYRKLSIRSEDGSSFCFLQILELRCGFFFTAGKCHSDILNNHRIAWVGRELPDHRVQPLTSHCQNHH